MMQDDCVFCQIVSKKEKAAVIYEDDYVLGFLDIAQVTPGHCLVIPKEHIKNLLTMNEKTASHLFRVIPDIARKLQKRLNAQGMNLVMNNEPVANQMVFHAHVHLIPRYNFSEIQMLSNKNPIAFEKLVILAEKIKK